MRRGVDPVLLSSLERGGYPIVLVHLDWPGVAAYGHSGVGDVVWNGHVWHGVGPAASIDIPAEAAEIAAAEAVLSLAGVRADLDGYANDVIRNRAVAVYLGAVAGRPGGDDGSEVSGPGSTLVGVPTLLFSGTMDGLTLIDAAEDGGVRHDVRLSIATGQEARSMASIYHSDEDQRRTYPGDTAGRLVILAYARAQKFTWPEN